MNEDQIPFCPIYHPTPEEFSDFESYIRKIYPEAKNYGICKIVPPKHWNPRHSRYCTVGPGHLNKVCTCTRSLKRPAPWDRDEKEVKRIKLEDHRSDFYVARRVLNLHPTDNGRGVFLLDAQTRLWWEGTLEEIQMGDLHQSVFIPDLNKKAKRFIHIKEEILCWKPNEYATKGNTFSKLKRLLKLKDLPDEMVLVKDMSKNEKVKFKKSEIRPRWMIKISKKKSKSSVKVSHTWFPPHSEKNFHYSGNKECSFGKAADVKEELRKLALVRTAEDCGTDGKGEKVKNRIIDHPISQNPFKVLSGVLQFIHEERSGRTLESFIRKSQEHEGRLPQAMKEILKEVDKGKVESVYKDLERDFWKNVANRTPIYGADLEGSLFHPEAAWNPAKFETLLSIIDKDSLPGVTFPYLYFGSYGALFGWHTEDVDLSSMNYLHFGRPKLWYGIPESDAAKFKKYALELVSTERCKEFTRHKSHMFHPKLLDEKDIAVSKAIQKANEFMITFPNGFHSGWNTGFNCAESVNFAFPEWVPIGIESASCTCGTLMDPVRMNVAHLMLRLKKKWPEKFLQIPDGKNILEEYYEEALEGERRCQEQKKTKKRKKVGRMF